MLFGCEPLSLQFRRLRDDLTFNQKLISRDLAFKKRELTSRARTAVMREVCKILGQPPGSASASETLASVSHDMRNPLTSILCMIHVLEAERARSGRVDDQLLEESLRAIRSSAERIKHLTCEVLTAQQRGTLHHLKRPVGVACLLSDAAELMSPVARDCGVELDLDLDPACAEERVRCDREESLRVFSNLLGNAITYSPKGATVLMRAQREGHEMVFSVSDSGPGISKAHQARIFERGWRGRQARSKGGLGLGLSIAREIVQSHGGRIWVESEVGNGSTFRFTLQPAKSRVARLERIA